MKRDRHRNDEGSFATAPMIAWLWTILFVGIVGSAFVQSLSIPKVIETATAAAPMLP